jgi:hypothetical protein
MMGMVYFFGGIAKLNYDWLFEAMPLKLWMRSKADLFLIGPLLAKEITPWIMAWTGMMLDLSISFLMINRRTRKFGFFLSVAFHFTNFLIFNIGIFPFLSIALTAMFFPPDWPRQLIDQLRVRWGRIAAWQESWQAHLAEAPLRPRRFWQYSLRWRWALLPMFVLLFLVHAALPLRHWAYQSDVAWSEEGHRYAWRMMLRSKRGYGHFIVTDLSTKEEEIVRPKTALSAKQARKIWTHPDMILQYAHHLRDRARAEGREVAIHAKVKVKLNDGQYHTYVDPEVDLTRVEWSFWQPAEWLMEEIK